MGGSGGGFFGSAKTEKVIAEIRKADEQSQNAELDAAVSKVIGLLLNQYNDRDSEMIRGHLESIKDALGKEIDGTIDLMYGGSVARHTYVDGISDIDSLVLLDNCDLSEGLPKDAKAYLAKRLQERFPNTTIHEGDLAVTVNFKDAQIQLVPAVRCNREVSISNETGNSWMRINPEGFAKALSKANQHAEGKLVPMIKIAKAINTKLPNNQQLTGYHLESLAIEIFKNYNGPKNTKHMLKNFFLEAPARILQPIKDKTGQTIHVDEYLGETESPERRIVSNAINRIGKQMRNADGAGSVEQWLNILGEV